MEHLSDKAQQALALPEQERIEYIRKDRWIGYSIARDVIFRLEDLLVYPKRSRMPNLLIVGDTNNGKTSIVKQFRDSHMPSLIADGAGLLALLCMCKHHQQQMKADYILQFWNVLLHLIGLVIGLTKN